MPRRLAGQALASPHTVRLHAFFLFSRRLLHVTYAKHITRLGVYANLTDHVRAAAHDDAAFHSLPERFVEHFDLTSLLMGWIGSDGNYRMALKHNFFDDESLRDYFLHWSQKDIWLASELERGAQSGVVSRISDYVPTQDYLASEFYREFMRPRGFDVIYAVSIHAVSELGLGALAMHRGPDKGDFTDAEVDELRLLAPDIEQMQKVRARLAQVAVAEKGYAMVIDRLQTAALVLGENAHLLEANCKGMAFLEHGDLLSRHGDIVTGRGGVARWLAEAVASATRTEKPVPSSARFERREREGVVMTVLPLAGDGFARRAMLAINFPHTLTEAHEPAIAAAFGLTRSEASVVRHLANGRNVEAVAKERGSSLATVRVQLRNAMMKTDCSRQAELIDLVRQFVSVADAEDPATV